VHFDLVLKAVLLNDSCKGNVPTQMGSVYVIHVCLNFFTALQHFFWFGLIWIFLDVV